MWNTYCPPTPFLLISICRGIRLTVLLKQTVVDQPLLLNILNNTKMIEMTLKICVARNNGRKEGLLGCKYSRENSESRITGMDLRYLATLQPQNRKQFQEKVKYVVDGELLEIQTPYKNGINRCGVISPPCGLK